MPTWFARLIWYAAGYAILLTVAGYALDPPDNERRIGDLHRDPHARLDEVPVGVVAQIAAQVGEDAGVGDLHIVVVPLAFEVHPQARQLPLGRRHRRHQNTRLAKLTTPSGSGHWPYVRSVPRARPSTRSSV